ncbi:MAG: hypothetical protein ACLSAF_07720 [Intestinimonas sp.]
MKNAKIGIFVQRHYPAASTGCLELLNKIPGVNVPMIASLEIERDGGSPGGGGSDHDGGGFEAAAEPGVPRSPEDPYAAVVPPDPWQETRTPPWTTARCWRSNPPLSTAWTTASRQRWGEDARPGPFPAIGCQTWRTRLMSWWRPVEPGRAVRLLERG